MSKCTTVKFTAKFLVVASGENSAENIPMFPGLENFPGDVIHSSSYKSGKSYSGKNVLVIGSGNSGMEIAYDLATHGANTSIVIRSPIHVMTKELIRLGMTLAHRLPLNLVDKLLVMAAYSIFGDLSQHGITRPKMGPMTLKSETGRSAVIDVGTVGLIKKGIIKPEIDEEDEKALAAFMSKDTSSKRSLGDIILQKIREKDATVSTEGRPAVKLDSRIIELYKEYVPCYLLRSSAQMSFFSLFLYGVLIVEFVIRRVGQLLSRYTSGKIPKAFKRIPSLECWADVLQLTEPQNWSPNAVYQATRLFSSNMNAKNAVRFYEAILLPRLRHDIKTNKRLHFALYQSMKKSLYKPAAFFKGILLPLCQEGNCTLREAVIIGSIIQKVTIPPLHASAALMKLADLEYCGTTSYFIKLFLDKKYALPYRVLDAVFAHFMRFLDDERSMPVIWHQSLLAFVERYKNELEKKDKEQLLRLLDNQKHYLVTPEIRRELRSSANRGEKPTDMSIYILHCPHH
ncbi:unnamed protein product [Triticum turgidum subsp. durum]|uniref:Bystin n=1 Tax=Triticum turgidum subsp. durum TaxID=4567 RepID=A0A9R1REX9_TRITD|nr:unnamed protein product [Triticum turgidum subsp. durum]